MISVVDNDDLRAALSLIADHVIQRAKTGRVIDMAHDNSRTRARPLIRVVVVAAAGHDPDKQQRYPDAKHAPAYKVLHRSTILVLLSDAQCTISRQRTKAGCTLYPTRPRCG